MDGVIDRSSIRSTRDRPSVLAFELLLMSKVYHSPRPTGIRPSLHPSVVLLGAGQMKFYDPAGGYTNLAATPTRLVGDSLDVVRLLQGNETKVAHVLLRPNR
jgi:hypothetical protein